MTMIQSAKSCNNPLSFCACIETIDVLENAWTGRTMQVRDCKNNERIMKRELHLVESYTFQHCYCRSREGRIVPLSTLYHLLREVACLPFRYNYRCQELPRPRSADAFALPFYSFFSSRVGVLQIT